MKKRALSALLCLVLCFTLAGQAAAAEGSVSFTVNGTPLTMDVPSYAEDGTTYVSYGAILFALYPDATAVWANGRAEVTAEGLSMYLTPGAKYIEACMCPAVCGVRLAPFWCRCAPFARPWGPRRCGTAPPTR